MRWVGIWMSAWMPLLVGCVPDVSPAAEWECAGAADASSWSRLLDGEPYGGVWSVATDCSGHIVTATVDGLTKLTPRGDVLWSSADGSSPFPPRVAVAPDDSIVVLAYQESPQLMRLGPDGALLWIQPIDPGDNPDSYLAFASSALDVALHGDIAVAAGFVGFFQVGDRSYSSGRCDDVLVALFDEFGNRRWATSFGSDGSGDSCLVVTSVTFDSDGHIVVTGHVTAGETPDGQEFLDLFMIKYDGADGTQMWLRQFGGLPLQITGGEFRFLAGSAIDGDNDVLIAAVTNHSINLGAGLIETDAYTGFVAKYAGDDGSFQWARQLDGVMAWDVAVAPGGDAVLLATEGTSRGLIARYSPSGELFDTQPLGYNTRTLAVDAGGNVLAGGTFYTDGKSLPALVRVGADGPPVIR